MSNMHMLWPVCAVLALLALRLLSHLLDADGRAARRDEREYGPEDLKAMLDDVPVGECPFCGGAVHLGLKRRNREYFRMVRLSCPNGCPLSCLLFGAEIPGPSVEEARENAARLWGRTFDAVFNPAACGRCGAKPVWRVRPGDYRLCCPECGNEGSNGIHDLASAARLWNAEQGSQRRAKDLEDRLNAA